MSGRRAISTTSIRELSSIFLFSYRTRQGVEGNSRNFDRNISLFSSERAKKLSAPLYRWHLKLKRFTKVVTFRYSPYHKMVAQLVEELHYKPESRGSNPESVIGIFY